MNTTQDKSYDLENKLEKFKEGEPFYHVESLSGGLMVEIDWTCEEAPREPMAVLAFLIQRDSLDSKPNLDEDNSFPNNIVEVNPEIEHEVEAFRDFLDAFDWMNVPRRAEFSDSHTGEKLVTYFQRVNFPENSRN